MTARRYSHLRRRLSGGRGDEASPFFRGALAGGFEPLDSLGFRLLADMLRPRATRDKMSPG